MNAPITLSPDVLLHDRYRVVRCIGGGGFSQVFEVQDGETLKVLKLLDLSAFPNPRIQQKVIHLFEREAEFLRQYPHPGIPFVDPDGYFQWGINGDRLHCLVMERIEGIDLEQWLEYSGQRLSQQQAIDWLRQLIHILSHLHQHQFFHRDIKPSNIMLRSNGQLAVIDFGGVREVTATFLAKQQVQETGTVIISAGYTPPEQAEGQAVPQSDFFAIGRTFVHLLTGEDILTLPKDPQTNQLIWRDRVPNHLTPLLAELIDHLMAPFPAQRPQTCLEIEQALTQIERRLWLRNYIPCIDRLPRRLKARKLLSLQPTFSVGLGLVLLASFAVWSQRFSLAVDLSEAGLNWKRSGNLSLAQQIYRLALIFDPQNPEASFNLGSVYETRSQIQQAQLYYQRAVEYGSAEAHNNLGRLKILDGDYEQAIALLKKGLDLNDRDRDRLTPEEFDRNRYALLKNLGWAQLGLKDYLAAQGSLEAAIALAPENGTAHCLMAQVWEGRVDVTQSRSAWERCLQYANLENPDEQVWIDRAQQLLQSSEVSP